MKFDYKISLLVLWIIITFNPTQSYSKAKVKLGIDILRESNFEAIRNKKIALFTNFSGRDSKGKLTVDILSESKLTDLVYIFTPEHGLYGSKSAGEKVGNDSYRSIPVVSLYGENRSPQNKYLNNIDAVVVDIQDIGVRSYTYLSSVYYILQSCAKSGKKVIICDRPNPLGGNIVDGGTVQPGYTSFVSIVPVSYIHGMTLGELAKMMNEEGWLSNSGEKLRADLEIIQMRGYRRDMTWEDTGLTWYPTSPNVPTINSVRGIAALGIIGELSIASVGIGTASPFCYLGSTDPKFSQLPKQINEAGKCEGINLSYCEYSPFFGFGSGKNLYGFYITFDPAMHIKPFEFGVKCLIALRNTFPSAFEKDNINDSNRKMFNKVTGSSSLFDALRQGLPDDMVLLKAEDGLEDFILKRSQYLLYD